MKGVWIRREHRLRLSLFRQAVWVQDGLILIRVNWMKLEYVVDHSTVGLIVNENTVAFDSNRFPIRTIGD